MLPAAWDRPLDGCPMPEPRTTHPRDLARLLDLLGRVDREFARPEDHLGARAPEVSGWSAGEHLFHLTLANDMSVKNARNLLEGRGRLRTDRVPLDPRASAVLARGRLPLGTEAPRFVRPPAEPDLAIARDIQGDVAEGARLLVQRTSDLRAAEQGIPHQTLGVLSAAEWLRFARIHTAHHLILARQVLAAIRA